MELTGTIEGRYQIRSRLGSGAFGEVYRALDQRLNREVAIKKLRVEAAFDEEEQKKAQLRFIQEARIAAQLHHPNIVTVHDVVGTPELLFMVQELVEGETLQERLKKKHKLDFFETLAIIQPAAEAIDFANRSGVVHRDVKPANIMIRHDGVVKVTDFGIAKMESTHTLTNTGHIVGTPNYMSPEQARGDTVDHRSDVFSLGCVLFECLSGKKAFDGDTVTAVLIKIVGEEPDVQSMAGTGLPEKILEVVSKSLAKDPDQRYANASAMLTDLEHAMAQASNMTDQQARDATIVAARALTDGMEIEQAPVKAQPTSDTLAQVTGSQERQDAPTDPVVEQPTAVMAPPSPPPFLRYLPIAIAAFVVLSGIVFAAVWVGRITASDRAAGGEQKPDGFVVTGDQPSWQERTSEDGTAAATDSSEEMTDGELGEDQPPLEDPVVRRPNPTSRTPPAQAAAAASTREPTTTETSSTETSSTGAASPVEESTSDRVPAAAVANPPPAGPGARPGPGETYFKRYEVREGIEFDIEPSDEAVIAIDGRVLGLMDDISDEYFFDRPGTYSVRLSAPGRITRWIEVKVHSDADDKKEEIEIDLKKIKKRRRGRR